MYERRDANVDECVLCAHKASSTTIGRKVAISIFGYFVHLNKFHANHVVRGFLNFQLLS